MSLQPQVYESPITINDVTGPPFPDLKQLYYIHKKKSALYNFKEEIMRLFVSFRYPPFAHKTLISQEIIAIGPL